MKIPSSSSSLPIPSQRRWYQFSLRTLLVAITVGAVLLAWIVVPLNRRHAVIEDLIAKKVYVRFMAAPADESWWKRTLRNYVPHDWFDGVEAVTFTDAKFGDAELAGMEEFSGLISLNMGGSQITNAGLSHISRLSHLQYLYLDSTRISDAGLVHLQKLPQLRILSINRTRIGDAGLVHLQGLTQLRDLSLNDTAITDVGLANLKSLSGLRNLYAERLKITNRGVDDLQQALPKCFIGR